MHHRATAFGLSLQVGVLLSILAALSVWAVHHFRAEATPASIRVAIGELRARTTDAELLAERDAAGQLPEHVRAVVATELATALRSSSGRLSRRTLPDSLQQLRATALAASDSSALSLETLASAPAGSASLAALRARLARSVTVLSSLEARLSP